MRDYYAFCQLFTKTLARYGAMPRSRLAEVRRKKTGLVFLKTMKNHFGIDEALCCFSLKVSSQETEHEINQRTGLKSVCKNGHWGLPLGKRIDKLTKPVFISHLVKSCGRIVKQAISISTS